MSMSAELIGSPIWLTDSDDEPPFMDFNGGGMENDSDDSDEDPPFLDLGGEPDLRPIVDFGNLDQYIAPTLATDPPLSLTEIEARNLGEFLSDYFDILFHVALHLPFRSVLALRSTNRQFSLICRANEFWRAKFEMDFGGTIQETLLSEVITQGRVNWAQVYRQAHYRTSQYLIQNWGIRNVHFKIVGDRYVASFSLHDDSPAQGAVYDHFPSERRIRQANFGDVIFNLQTKPSAIVKYIPKEFEWLEDLLRKHMPVRDYLASSSGVEYYGVEFYDRKLLPGASPPQPPDDHRGIRSTKRVKF